MQILSNIGYAFLAYKSAISISTENPSRPLHKEELNNELKDYLSARIGNTINPEDILNIFSKYEIDIPTTIGAVINKDGVENWQNKLIKAVEYIRFCTTQIINDKLEYSDKQRQQNVV